MKPVTDPNIVASLDAQPSAVNDPATLANLDYGIDITQDTETVRKSISSLKGKDREKALRHWADYYVNEEEKQGGVLQGIDNRVRAIARGTLIGSFLDEFTAATSSAPYDETLAYQRARDRRFDSDNPIESIGLKLAGGVASGVGAARAIPVAVPSTVLGRAGAGAAYGAGAGAIAGFGEGQGLQNRLDTAATGAKFGAALGGAAPVAIQGIASAARPIANQLAPGIVARRSGPAAAGDHIIRQNIERSGRTVQDHINDIGQTAQAKQFGPNSRASLPDALADQSDSLQRLTGSVYRSGGAAGNYTREILEARQRGATNPFAPTRNAPVRTGHLQGQARNVIDAFDRALRVSSRGTARQVEQGLISAQKKEGRHLYAVAYRNSDDFDLGNPLTAFSLRTQQYPEGSKMSRQMDKALRLFVPRTANAMAVTNIRRFDAAKKALDDSIDKAMRGGNGNLARELTQFKQELLASVHRNGRNQAYADARAAWGSTAERRDAIEAGRNAFREDSQISAEAFRAMSPGDQQHFRIGMRDALRKTLARKRSGHDVTLPLQERNIQELMAAVIPRRGKGGFKDSPERFGNFITRQNRMTTTRQRVLGGSQTAERTADDLQFGAQAAASFVERLRDTPSMRALVAEYISDGAQKFFGFRQDVALQMARRLLETRPERRIAYLESLKQQVKPDQFRDFVVGLERATRIAGRTAGRQAVAADGVQ